MPRHEIQGKFTGRIAAPPRKFFKGWACPTCKRFGYVQVELGGPIDPRTGKRMPKTDDEAFRKLLWESHRTATSGLCVGKVKRFLVDQYLLFDHRTADGKIQRIVVHPSDQPPPTEHRWPPVGF